MDKELNISELDSKVQKSNESSKCVTFLSGTVVVVLGLINIFSYNLQQPFVVR